MGLNFFVKGESVYWMGYGSYGCVTRELAYAAYGKEMGDLYGAIEYGLDPSKHCIWNQVDSNFWNARCNDDLDLLLFHSDCDGKFTPKECRRVYNAIKDLRIADEDTNEKLEALKEVFRRCARQRVNLYYG